MWVAEDGPSGPRPTRRGELQTSLWDFVCEFSRSSGPAFTILAVKGRQEFQAKGRLLVGGGKAPAALLLISDRSPIAILREALGEARQSSMHLASTSHELRSPLCSVISALEFMGGTVAGESEQQRLNALSTAKYLLNTVCNVLVPLLIRTCRITRRLARAVSRSITRPSTLGTLLKAALR